MTIATRITNSLLLLICVACIGPVGDGPVPAKNEIVMAPMSSITATTPNGVITIRAGKGLKRSYTWDGATRAVEMWPRTERWYGSLGLYYPGPGNHWWPHKGVTRGVVQEGQQHFATAQAAMAWLADQAAMPLVYTNDGLAVSWGIVPGRNQLNVDVWQIYIGGSKPTVLPGATDRLIHRE